MAKIVILLVCLATLQLVRGVESERAFLNGLNQAWVNYGDDFGNSPPPSDSKALAATVRTVSWVGGNAMRIWVHCGGFSSPQFNSSGFVNATDSTNSLIPDMANLLAVAQQHNVSIFFVLWNAAVPMSDDLLGLLTTESKLQSYIDVVLVSMIQTLSKYTSLGGIEIMNEPEGALLPQSNPKRCLNTTYLSLLGVGWSGQQYPIEVFQKFINLQAAAIHRTANVKVLVGSWSEASQTDAFGFTNFYSDECLIAAGGDILGTLDYNEMHCYDVGGVYSPTAPFRHNATSYKLSKPLIIGEFSQSGGAGWTTQQQYTYLLQNGYAGAWGWQATGGGTDSDGLLTLSKGIHAAALANT